MDEADILVTDDLDLVNQSETAEIVAEHLLGHAFIQSTKIDVTAGIALLDALQNLARDWAGFSPTNFEFVSVKSDLLDGRVGMESSGGRSIQERNEDARLFGQDANGLEGTEMNQIQELID